MPAPLLVFSGGALAASLVAGVALTGLLVTAPPPPPETIWFDTPEDLAQIEPGLHAVALHVTDEHQTVRLNILRDGVVIDSLVDADFEQQPGAPDRIAWRAEFSYEFTAGSYLLEPFLDGRSVRAREGIRVLVGDVPLDVPAPAPTATPTATPTASATPTEAPTAAPVPTVAPTVAPPPSPPAATPAPTLPPPPPPVVFGGTVTRTQPGGDDWESRYRATGISPSGAIARIQTRVLTSDGSAVVSDWVAFDCVPDAGTQSPWSCTVASARVNPARGHLYRIEYRLQLTSAGNVWYGPSGSYQTSDFHIG